jgi:hypothetical protein
MGLSGNPQWRVIWGLLSARSSAGRLAIRSLLPVYGMIYDSFWRRGASS